MEEEGEEVEGEVEGVGVLEPKVEDGVLMVAKTEDGGVELVEVGTARMVERRAMIWTGDQGGW